MSAGWGLRQGNYKRQKLDSIKLFSEVKIHTCCDSIKLFSEVKIHDNKKSCSCNSLTSYALDFITCDKWLNSSGPSNDTEVWGKLVDTSFFKWNSNSSAHLPGTVWFHFQNGYARPRQERVGKRVRKINCLSSTPLPLSLPLLLSPPMPLCHSFSFPLTHHTTHHESPLTSCFIRRIWSLTSSILRSYTCFENAGI